MRMARYAELGWFVLFGIALLGAHVETRVLAARAERAHPPHGDFVEVDGLRLHFSETGGGEETVVFLHGNPGFLHDFDAVMPLAGAAGLRAIALDRPGHGFSERPAGAVDVHAQARLVHVALEALGVARPVLVAHSWSGALVLAYALDYPGEVRGLVLLAPVAYGDQEFGSRIDRLAALPVLGRLVAWTAVTPFAESMIRPVLSAAYAPDPVPEAYAERALALWSRPGQFLAWAEDMNGLRAELQAMSPRYGSIWVPVAIVLGQEDRLVPGILHGEPLSRAILGAQLQLVLHLGHEIPQLRPDVVMTALARVLEEARGVPVQGGVAN